MRDGITVSSLCNKEKILNGIKLKFYTVKDYPTPLSCYREPERLGEMVMLLSILFSLLFLTIILPYCSPCYTIQTADVSCKCVITFECDSLLICTFHICNYAYLLAYSRVLHTSTD